MARRNVAYVPEGRGVFPNLTVRENLVMAARPARANGAAWTLERILASFPRLGERLDRPGGQLSGGEQQMLAIGRALLTQPELLILDEATEGLAPLIVREVWGMIAQIRAAGVATLIVDRNYRRVAENADRLVVLQKGTVALSGLPQPLLATNALAGLLGI
jgi:branched-chain amino acid transport system ATP-binding protein